MTEPYVFASSQTKGFIQLMPIVMVTLMQVGNLGEPLRSPLLHEKIDSINCNYYRPAMTILDEPQQLQIINDFATNLLANIEDMDVKIAKVINSNFRDIYEQF